MRAMTAALTTTPWQWTLYAGDDQVITVEHPGSTPLTFTPTVRWKLLRTVNASQAPTPSLRARWL